MNDPRLETIFSAALQKGSAGERAAYVEGACGENAELRAGVETLLRAHGAAGAFLEATGDEGSLAEGPGTVIGRYKLLQLVGEGGFGVVYMAEQLEPVRRKVALKIIKLGMDTRQVVARFESERQALALMDHENIARVFDGGATESGRPYFVMELVKGIPITEYCDQNQLTPQQRSELLIPVCQAVQHAHQKGIIHRDLKPSNVLVTLHDGRPVPKVIDFGIAKATNQRLTEKTLFTEFRQFIGTPQYMSPEQAEMSGLDVDTRSDIYSLGVLLYELLAGSTPFEADALRAAGYAEMQRMIREDDPPSPSVRVSTLRDGLVAVARHRRVEGGTLPKLLQGDMDWIVMKCLEKDRTRRYASAGDLAADIQRHLENEPVQASPPSLTYRLQKFARRNRAGVLAGLLVAAALVTGLSLASAGFWQASREAQRATQEARRSQAVADFLQEILASIDPDDAARRHLEVEAVTARARELFGEDHATVAATLSSLALQLQQSGNLTAAEPLFRESLRLWRKAYGDQHANVGITLSRLGSLLRSKGDDVGAEQLLREALAVSGKLPGATGLAFCESRTQLAELVKRRGKLEEAETLVREALAIRRAQGGSQDYHIGATLEQLTGLLVQQGKIEEAEKTFEEMLAAYRPLFPPDGLTAASHSASYGHWLRQQGRSEKAEPHFRNAIRIYRQHSNPPREYYLVCLDGLFQLVRQRKDAAEETLTLFHECMANMKHIYGQDHEFIAQQLLGFAQVLATGDRPAEAIELIVEGLRMYRNLQKSDWDAQPSLKLLEASVRRVVMTPEQPADRYQRALSGAEALLAEQADQPAWLALRGMAQYRLGQYKAAEGTLKAAIASNGSEASRECEPFAFLAMAQIQLGNVEPAKSQIEKARTAAQAASPLAKESAALLAEAEALLKSYQPQQGVETCYAF